MSVLHLKEREVYLMPLSLLLDLFAIDLQAKGISKPKREVFIDDIMP